MVEPQAQHRNIGMTFPHFETQQYVDADRTRLKQIFINLLSNAIKYNAAGGSVMVTFAAAAENRIRISVKDAGAGLAPEKLAQLFQPFNRLGQETGGEEGTGIGLVVTKRLVELLGGAIGVESVVGEGSTFWIELLETAAPEFEAEEMVASKPETPEGSRARTVVYVEDNPANLKLVEQLILRRPDWGLLTATNGRRGVELVSVSMPDVILMDINLPDISGVEVLKILRANPATAHIPVIALSANAMPRDIEQGMQAGFFFYLTKPIRVDEFLNTLDEALKLVDQTVAGAGYLR